MPTFDRISTIPAELKVRVDATPIPDQPNNHMVSVEFNVLGQPVPMDVAREIMSLRDLEQVAVYRDKLIEHNERQTVAMEKQADAWARIAHVLEKGLPSR